MLCTRPSSASLTLSSGFKIYNQHVSGVLFSQALLSHLPALKSMMFAGSSGSVLLQRDGVTFAISEMVSVPCGCCSVFNIHNPDPSRAGAASCGFTRWELGSHDNANDYGSFPRGSVIQLTARDSRDSRSPGSESKEKSIA